MTLELPGGNFATASVKVIGAPPQLAGSKGSFETAPPPVPLLLPLELLLPVLLPLALLLLPLELLLPVLLPLALLLVAPEAPAPLLALVDIDPEEVVAAPPLLDEPPLPPLPVAAAEDVVVAPPLLEPTVPDEPDDCELEVVPPVLEAEPQAPRATGGATKARSLRVSRKVSMKRWAFQRAAAARCQSGHGRNPSIGAWRRQ